MGRPRSKDPLVFKTVGFTESQWEYISLWLPSGSPTEQLRSLLERCLKFWPSGPGRFR